MSTVAAAQAALLERVRTEAGLAGTDAEGLNNLGTTLIQVGGVFDGEPTAEAMNAYYSLVGRIETEAKNPTHGPEEISFLGETLGLLAQTVTVAEFRLIYNDGVAAITRIVTDLSLDLSSVRNEAVAYIASVCLETEDWHRTMTSVRDATQAHRAAAKTSETNSKASETASKASENASKASQTASKTSETNSKASEVASKASENAAAGSASTADGHRAAAAGSATSAAGSATAAAGRATASDASAQNSATSARLSGEKADASSASAAASKISEDNSKASELASKTSETNAAGSATASAGSATTANNHRAAAAASEDAAKTSETNAAGSATAAAGSASAAAGSASNADGSAKASATSAVNSKSDADRSVAAANRSEAADLSQHIPAKGNVHDLRINQALPALPSTGSTLNDGRKSKHLAMFRGASSQSMTGAIAFISPAGTDARVTMMQLKIEGHLYSPAQVVDLTANVYLFDPTQVGSTGSIQWLGGKVSMGSLDVQLRFARLDNRMVVILGDVNTVWSYPIFSLEGMGAGSRATDALFSSWSTALVTDLSVYTDLSANVATSHALSAKANLASPALTGVPTAPTAADGTSTNQVSTTAFVSTAVANAIATIRNSVPAAYNTLKGLYDLLVEHTSRTNNPHNTTKAQVGLGNVDNRSEAEMAASGSIRAVIEDRASAWGAQHAGARVARTGDTMTGNLTLAEANARFLRGSVQRLVHFDGGWFGFLGNDGAWDFRVNDGGEVWTAQFGDLNARIENRATAIANAYSVERVSRHNDTVSGYIVSHSYLRGMSNYAVSYAQAGIQADAPFGEALVGFHNHGVAGAQLRLQSGHGIASINSDNSNYIPLRASAFNVPSDQRLKEAIAPVDFAEAVTLLSSLKPIWFDYRSDVDTVQAPNNERSAYRASDTLGGNTLGFLAHEVQKILPGAASGYRDEVDKDGQPIYQAVDHSKLVPLLTAALQSALSDIATLKANMAVLQGNAR